MLNVHKVHTILSRHSYLLERHRFSNQQKIALTLGFFDTFALLNRTHTLPYGFFGRSDAGTV